MKDAPIATMAIIIKRTFSIDESNERFFVF